MNSYFVCQASDTKKLQEAVNAAIADGWQPIGGIAVAFDTDWTNTEDGMLYATGGTSLFCQAVGNEFQTDTLPTH